MSHSILMRSAAAALVAAMLLPAASFAQGTTRAAPGFAPQAAGNAACTQLELNSGVRGDDCGQLTLSELALLKSKKDNTN